MDEIRAPKPSDRTMILGRTGSGKSQFGLDLLSKQNFHEQPWVMIDYKGEDLIDEIREATGGAIKEIKVTDPPPKKPGLYYMNPAPVDDDEAMDLFLRRCLAQGKIGLFIDEGYALPKYGNGPGFTRVLTQGRSKKVPVICLYQRPVWMSRFAISQSDFRCLFKLDDERDEKTAKDFIKAAELPGGGRLGPMELDALPPYYSLWHDVAKGKANVLKPGADKQTIIRTFQTRLHQRRKGVFV